MKYDFILDAQNLLCPIPILKAKKILKNMEGGEILLVKTTDPSSEGDFKLFSKQTKNELLKIEKYNDEFLFYIKKTKAL
tara:strand:- start:6288 stop:6524 length:237 start_codon:yes stop_codon:yes gene_type:complete